MERGARRVSECLFVIMKRYHVWVAGILGAFTLNIASQSHSGIPYEENENQQTQSYRIKSLFHEFQIHEKAISDFLPQQSSAVYWEISPRTIHELRKIVQIAYQENMPLRIRARGHSLNSSSLPRANEMLIRTNQLTEMRYEEEGTVTAGAGIPLWTIQSHLAQYGLALPVINDGFSGPSLGGYISAGGIGLGSAVYGGFWENVAEIKLIDGQGNLLTVDRDDDLFSWLFGSMGQLGIIVEAKLDVLSNGDSNAIHAQYPMNLVVSPREVEKLDRIDLPIEEGRQRVVWFTLFIPPDKEDIASAHLIGLEGQFNAALRFEPRSKYPIKFRSFNPPLIYPKHESFLAIGIWGYPREGQDDVEGQLYKMENAFLQLAINNGYQRYIQTELAKGQEIYERYFDKRIFDAFRALKEKLDPKFILNRDSVFPTGY
jgi:hypothetical protein